MKTRLLAGSLVLALGAFGADFWWVGTASSDPMVPANWYASTLPGQNDSANVNDGAAKPLTITSETGLECGYFKLGANASRLDNTVVMNGGWLSVKNELQLGGYQSSGGTFTLNGGELSVYVTMYVGSAENSVATFRMTGGTLNVSNDLVLNRVKTARGTFEMTGGTLNLVSGKSFAVPLRGDVTATVSGPSTVINFNGAYIFLAACRNWYGEAAGHGEFTLADGATLNNIGNVQVLGEDSSFTCNGGVIVCGKAGTLFNSSGKLYVGTGGLTVDTQGYDVTLGKPMLASAGATSGGLVKRGTGTLKLSAGNTYLPGPVSIEAGKVVAYGPDALPGYATESFSLAAGATLELGPGWGPAQVAALQALPTVLGTVTRSTSLAIDTDTVISEDLTAADVAAGAIANPKTGAGALILTGHNDFGGQFAVEQGALVADWGEGIAWTDNLRLGAVSSFNKSKGNKFGPISGLVTNAVGTGAGEIFFPTNAEAGFVGYVPTTVRLYDDATRALKVNVDLPRMLTINTTTLTNDVHFQNPVELNDATVAWDVWVDAGHCYLDGAVNYTVDGTPSTAKGSLAKKGEGGVLHMPPTSTFQLLYSQGGLLEFPENSRFTGALASTIGTAETRFLAGSKAALNGINGTGGFIFFEAGSELEQKGGITMAKGELVVSNATFTMSGGDFITSGGKTVVKGGSFTNTSSGWTYTKNVGQFVLDGCTASFKASVVAGYDTSKTNFSGKSLLQITGGAQVSVPAMHVMNGDLEISGEGTRVVGSSGVYAGGGNAGATTNGFAMSRIFVKAGSLEPAGDFNVGHFKGTTGRLFISGGTVKMASGKSITAGNSGNGIIEVSGGLLDASVAYGLVMLPRWDSAVKDTVSADWAERGIARFLGGETRVKQVAGNSGRDCHVVFDGGLVTFVNPSATTIFNGINTRQIGVNGGEIDTGTASLTVFGAFTALTNQTPVAVTGTDLNTAPAFAKSGAGTLTMVGENTYSCGTEVKAGTLAVKSGAKLPTDQFLRVAAGSELDLGGNAQTVTALLGTGKVKTGTLTVTDAIYPAGVGTVGTLTLTDVAPQGRVVIDVADDGSYDKLLVNGTLDASKLTIEFADVDNLAKQKMIRIVEATAITGRPEVSNLPKNYSLNVGPTGISVARGGMVVYVR